MHRQIDTLIDKIKKMSNPSCVGLDTDFEYLPDNIKNKCKDRKSLASAIIDFNNSIMLAIKDTVPCIKVQVAYYEQYGVDGMYAFESTLKTARELGFVTIADVKRNDIGSTADCYARAYLSGITLVQDKLVGFDSHFVTVNAYLGDDGILPFVRACETTGKGIFVLVKTSNPSSVQLQDRRIDSGQTIYSTVGSMVSEWGKGQIGTNNYSSVGAVVGATNPKQAKELRRELPHTFFLVPGYGAQGGTAKDLAGCFDSKGGGAIVNSSRGIICAYKNPKYSDKPHIAAYQAAQVMQEEVYKICNFINDNL